MPHREKERLPLSSGNAIYLRKDVLESTEFDRVSNDAGRFSAFLSRIYAGFYAAQIFQFVETIIAVCSGRSSLVDLLSVNLLCSVGITLLWMFCQFYRIPFINTVISAAWGIVRNCRLNHIAVIAVALFVAHDWLLILYYIVATVAAYFARAVIYRSFIGVNYCKRVLLHTFYHC